MKMCLNGPIGVCVYTVRGTGRFRFPPKFSVSPSEGRGGTSPSQAQHRHQPTTYLFAAVCLLYIASTH